MSSSRLTFLRLPGEIRNEIYKLWVAQYKKGHERIFVSNLHCAPFRGCVRRAFYEACVDTVAQDPAGAFEDTGQNELPCSPADLQTD